MLKLETFGKSRGGVYGSFLGRFAAISILIPTLLSQSMASTSPEDARTILVTLAETGSKPASIDTVRSLVESYRIDRGDAYLPLADAPYPRFLINAQIGEIYPALYTSALNDFLDHIPLDLLFDGVLGMVRDKKIPDAMKEKLSKISPRMAKRALKGAGPDCELDTTDAAEKSSTVGLIMLKIDFANVISACTYRKRLYHAMKEELVKAAKTPETKALVREQAKDKFPDEFRKGFLTKINSTLGNFSTLVNEKFNACEKAAAPVKFGLDFILHPFGTKAESGCTSLHPIWGSHGSVIEAGTAVEMQSGRRKITLKAFAQGLLADLFAARVLIASPIARDRSLAAGLFYAVVNRWLFLTGGITADWDAKKREMPIAQMGEKMNPPKFKEVPFGGWGAQSVGFGVSMSSWDWAAYNPTDEKNPTPIRLFPTRFEIDENGVGVISDQADAYQTNDDLAYMLLAVSEFLKATQPGTPFAKFFGGKDKVADLLDAKKPMLFPTEGRMIAVGVLAAVAQNLLNPTIGHVGSKSTGLPLVFRDHASFNSLSDVDIDTRGVASLLVAAAKLRKILKVDPILDQEPKLKSVMGDVETLVQLGALVVGRDAQGTDGSVRAKMRSSDASITLGSQLAGIRVFLAAFNDSVDSTKANFVQARLVAALQYFFANQLNDPSSLDLEARLNVVAVWNQCQAELRKIRSDLPWADWEQKIRNVRTD